MRRTRLLLLSVTVGLALLGSSACGVAANTTAATVSGLDVQVDDVDTLAADEMFTGAPAEPGNESTLDGDVARSVLAFEIERVAWLAEVQRWGLEITGADRSAAEQQLDAQAGQSGGGTFAGKTRTLLVEYLAAQSVLTQRFSTLDPSNRADLQQLYDGSDSSWDRACLVVVRVPVDQDDTAEQLLDDGVGIEQLPDRLDGATVVADPSQSCISQSQLPAELREAVAATSVGRTSRVIFVDDGAGGLSAFVLRLDERQRIGLDEAVPELTGIIQTLVEQGPRSWIQLQTSEAEINPRYGSDVSVGGQGELAIVAPPAPQLPRAQLITESIAAAEAAATAAEAAAAQQAAAAGAGGGAVPGAVDPATAGATPPGSAGSGSASPGSAGT